jgi:N6-L-threonylcarbamoyladenine synthase
MLSLPYPGGPSIDKAAKQGDRAAFRFPRALLDNRERLDFSFSGLKTAVRYKIAGPGRVDFAKLELEPQLVADLCASFQEAVVDCLVGKSLLALQKTGLATLCVGGGVAANTRLRERLEDARSEHDFELVIPPLPLCTDNAVMGAIAVERLRAGDVDDLDLDVQPGMIRMTS